MSDIDSLDIKIAASADKAVQSINTLITKLNEVKSALNMGNVANIVSNSMKNVGSSVENSMQKAEQTVEKTTKKIGRTFDDISKKYGHIGVGFDIAGASKETYQKYLNNFMNQQANALEKIQELEVGGKTGSQAYETAVKNYTILGNKIDSIVEKMRKMDMPLQTDEELEKVVFNAKRAGTAISEATKEEERFAYVSQNAGNYNASAMEAIFGKAASGIRNYQDAIDTFGVSAGKAMNDVNAKVENINIPLLTSKLGEATQKAMSLGDVFRTLHVKNASEGMDKVQTEIEKVKRKYDELVDKIKLFNDYSNNYQNTRTYAEHQHKIDGLINDYARLIQMQEMLSREADNERVSQSFARMKSGIGKVFGVIGSLVSKIKQYVTHSKKAYSATELLKKATNNLTKSLTKVGRMFRMMVIRMALRKVIENIATGFKGLALYSEEFNQSISMLIGSLKQLGYSISAAVGPLVNAFAPAINRIIQLCITAVNYINQLISALSGKGTWIRAKKQVVDYAKSLKGAGKEAKGSLLALDELNNITTNSGGGSGANDINPDDMYETVEIESKILDLADKIKEMWASGDFTDLGNMIGTKIKNGLDSIDWKSIQESAEKIGKSIGTFTTGFVETENLGNSIGQTFANAINTAFTFINSILDNTNFRSIGKFLSDAITWAFTTIDFKKIAHSVSETVKGLLDLFIGFAEETDWKKFGNKVFEKIAEFVGNIDWSGIADRLFEGLGAALGGIAAFLWGLIESAWNSVVQWWYDVAFEDGEFTISGLLEGIAKALVNIGTWIKDHIFKPFIDGFKKAFGINSPSKVMKEQGNFIMQGLYDGINSMVNKVVGIFTTIKNKIVSIWNSLKTATSNIWNNGIVPAIKKPINSIIGFVNRMISGITDGLNGVIGVVKGLKFEIPDWIPKWGGKKFELNIPTLKAPQIPMLATGGFVDDYSLFAAGENGIPEILGTVGGRTAVAGGAEITGIRDAIYETASEEVVLLRQQNQLLQGILQKEFGISKSDIGKAARNYGKEYYDRTGDNAFVF